MKQSSTLSYVMHPMNHEYSKSSIIIVMQNLLNTFSQCPIVDAPYFTPIYGPGINYTGGGLQHCRGGGEFYPYKTGEAQKVLAMLKRGQKCFGVVLMRELEVLAILNGGQRKLFPPFKRGGGGDKKVSPCLEGERKMFQRHDIPIL